MIPNELQLCIYTSLVQPLSENLNYVAYRPNTENSVEKEAERVQKQERIEDPEELRSRHNRSGTHIKSQILRQYSPHLHEYVPDGVL